MGICRDAGSCTHLDHSGGGCTVAARGSDDYAVCIDRIKEKYYAAYEAVVSPDPDLVVMVRDTSGLPLAVGGVTSAADRRLMSENYLDTPVELTCARIATEAPARRTICEMGPVASFHPGAGRYLMERFPGVVTDLGFDFIVATLTRQLYSITRQCGWDFVTIANARLADLRGRSQVDWGRYYLTKPRTGILRCDTYGTAIDYEGAA